MKDTLTEMRNSLQGINSTVDEAKNPITDLEYKKQKTPNQNIKKKKRIQKNENGIKILWDNFKLTNIHIIGMLEEEEKEQEIGNLKK